MRHSMNHIPQGRPSGRRVHQFAEDIGVSDKIVYRAIKAGHLRAARIGSAFVVTDDAARAWLDACSNIRPQEIQA
jgi:excisionase family DNA binding protein